MKLVLGRSAMNAISLGQNLMQNPKMDVNRVAEAALLRHREESPMFQKHEKEPLSTSNEQPPTSHNLTGSDFDSKF